MKPDDDQDENRECLWCRSSISEGGYFCSSECAYEHENEWGEAP